MQSLSNNAVAFRSAGNSHHCSGCLLSYRWIVSHTAGSPEPAESGHNRGPEPNEKSIEKIASCPTLAGFAVCGNGLLASKQLKLAPALHSSWAFLEIGIGERKSEHERGDLLDQKVTLLKERG
jgi:hypothetical protein